LQDTLIIAIVAQMTFEKDDFQDIYSSFRGHYWFGQSSNGANMGEWFYKKAIEVNNKSAMLSYESFIEIKPFIHDNKRVVCGLFFKHGDRTLKITGFNKEKEITAVSYLTENLELVRYSDGRSYIKDTPKSGKKLLKFTNKEWLSFRKEIDRI